MTTHPRWLMLSLLPVLVLALDGFQLDLTFRFYIFVKRQGASMDVLMPLQFLVAPVLTAAVFAYPLARLYGRYGVLVAAVMSLLAGWHGMRMDAFTETGLGGRAIWGSLSLWTTGLTMLATHVCHYWLRHSQLAIVCNVAEQEASTATSPRWLMGWILPLAAAALYHIDTTVGPLVGDTLEQLAGTERLPKRVAYASTGVVFAALMAVVFAYPTARLYARWARLAAVVMVIPTALYWLDIALGAALEGRWVGVLVTVGEPLGLLTLVPLAAWWVQRRLAGSRLVVLSAEGDREERLAVGGA